jgi:hypothetical protein
MHLGAVELNHLKTDKTCQAWCLKHGFWLNQAPDPRMAGRGSMALNLQGRHKFWRRNCLPAWLCSQSDPVRPPAASMLVAFFLPVNLRSWYLSPAVRLVTVAPVTALLFLAD